MQKRPLFQSKRFLFSGVVIALALMTALSVAGFYLKSVPWAHVDSQRALNQPIDAETPPPSQDETGESPVQESAAPKITEPLKDPRIVVVKSSRRADLYSGDRLIKSYKIAVGPNPVGHKARKGDGRTPEGHYRLCSRLERSRFHIFLGVNYPTVYDANQALERQAITEKDFLRISEAERNRQMPPWDTPLSGAIGLHGGGANSDWTLGFIAFENPDIEDLLVATTHWTPVEIQP
jgi:hypothetical protein